MVNVRDINEDAEEEEENEALLSELFLKEEEKKKNPNQSNKQTKKLIIVIVIIIIAFKGAIRDFFYNLLTTPRTVSNMYSQVARAQSCMCNTSC